MSTKLSEKLWVEKYRPSEIAHIIIPNRIRTRFESGEIGSNLLLGGTAGVGKTTLAKCLAKGRSTLFINASQNRGIDTVRNEIADFARTGSMLSSKKKVIICDEADNFSQDAQKALKGSIEEFSENVFFIFTANNPERLISPLHSRLEFINFNFTADEEKEQQNQYGRRILMILEKEGGYKIDREALLYLLKKLYPDLRKIINMLYQTTRSIEKGGMITLDLLTKSYIGTNDQLYETLAKEHQEEKIYQFIRNNFNGKEHEALLSLGEPFLVWLNNSEDFKDKTLPASMIAHKYIYESSTGAIDPLITLLAACSAMSSILK
jgi:DNA polymerase III delta prime subunit